MHFIFPFQIAEEKYLDHLLVGNDNYASYFLPGVGILIIFFFFENVKIPTLCQTLPPSSLTLIGA